MSIFQKIALQLRLGKTQSEIAARFGVSRQRVHQIARKVLPHVERKRFKCKRCKHRWRSRGRTLERANTCPKCGTHYWDTVRPEPKQPQSIYQCWQNMLARCRNPNLFAYRFCGARGVGVCARWKRFENFVADMGKKPKGRILIRIKSDGDFGPRNCKWGTRKEQALNRRARGSSQCPRDTRARTSK
jgi:ribosomal protein L37AE/L43A